MGHSCISQIELDLAPIEDIGCTRCAAHGPVNAIPFKPYQRHTIDDERCTRCDTCREVRPEAAVVITSGGIQMAISCSA